ncbi:MAG: hypothetical protein K2U26_11525, partial [Cyclobacteriaceae bacterium]|nr:hypothetical protein [Cyclobacteriaceae bacterium]
MRVIIKRLLIGSLGFLMISCLSESGKDPGKPSTFVRYYSGGTSDQAVDMRETADKGLAIIGNTLDGIKFFK